MNQPSLSRRRLLSLAAGAAGAVLLAGCGGSAAPPAPSSTAPVSSPASAPAAASASAGTANAAPSTSVAASSSAAAKPSGAVQAATISSAFLRLVGDAPNVIAQQRGYFKEVGIDFTLVPFDGGSKAMPSLSTGQIDILPATADVNFFNAVARGIQLRIGADDSTLAPGHDIYGMAVRKELVDSGRYKSPKDFKGMKVAVSSLTGSLYYIVALLAQKNGFTLKDMDISALAFADALVALKQGGIDAANLVEPFTSRSETEGFAKVTLRSLDISPDIPGAHLMMSPQFVQKGDVAVRFYTAWLRGLRDYLTEFVNGKNSDQMVKLLQANQIAIVPTAQNPTFDPDGKVPVKPVKDLFQFFKDLGQIQGNVDPDSTFDQSFVTKAAQQLGPYKP